MKLTKLDTQVPVRCQEQLFRHVGSFWFKRLDHFLSWTKSPKNESDYAANYNEANVTKLIHYIAEMARIRQRTTKICNSEKNSVQKLSLTLLQNVRHKGFNIKNVTKAWGCTVTTRERDCCNSWRNLSKCANLTLPFNSSDFGQLFKSTISPLHHKSRVKYKRKA